MELLHFYGGFGKGTSACALREPGSTILYGRTLGGFIKKFDPTRHALVILNELRHCHLIPLLDHLMHLSDIDQGPRYVVVITDDPPHVATMAYPFQYVMFPINGPF